MADAQREAFEKWAADYGLRYEPNYSKDTEADCWSAWQAALASQADVARDAERWRYLVRENNKGGRGAFRIVWFDEPGEGFATTDGVSVNGKDESAIVRIIDAAMASQRGEAGHG